MRRLLLFDIDGTILNLKTGVSKGIFIETFKEVFNVDVPLEKLPVFSGNTDLNILKSMSEAVDLDFQRSKELIDEFWERKVKKFSEYCIEDHVSLIPGIDDILQMLSNNKEYDLALVTGNSRRNAYQKLSSFGLERFFSDGAFGCEYVEREKLPPLAIERINKLNSTDEYNFHNSLIIGDTISDIFAAKSNGMKVITVAKNEEESNKFKNHGSDSIIRDFSDSNYFINEINRILN